MALYDFPFESSCFGSGLGSLAEVGRTRVYTVCYFANLCRNVLGDFALVLFDFTDFVTLGKTLQLIDPFEGIVSNKSDRLSNRYNRDPDRVFRQYAPNAPLELLPLWLPTGQGVIFERQLLKRQFPDMADLRDHHQNCCRRADAACYPAAGT